MMKSLMSAVARSSFAQFSFVVIKLGFSLHFSIIILRPENITTANKSAENKMRTEKIVEKTIEKFSLVDFGQSFQFFSVYLSFAVALLWSALRGEHRNTSNMYILICTFNKKENERNEVLKIIFIALSIVVQPETHRVEIKISKTTRASKT